jgi:hypothetical protein
MSVWESGAADAASSTTSTGSSRGSFVAVGSVLAADASGGGDGRCRLERPQRTPRSKHRLLRRNVG